MSSSAQSAGGRVDNRDDHMARQARGKAQAAILGLLLVLALPGRASAVGPTIDVWAGLSQQFGHLGTVQPWCNILGNVSDPQGVASLSYSLNGGPAVSLTVGADGRRLQSAGDFNIDLTCADLDVGSNDVVITATDTVSDQTIETVTVQYTAGVVWPETDFIDWSTASSIQDVAQVVDGLWTLGPSSVTTAIPGYDRLIGVGDVLWDDYEVTVPITINGGSSSGGVGILLRWNGHTDFPISGLQPKTGYLPLGAIGWYRNGGLEIFPNDQSVVRNTSVNIPNGVPHIFKMRVETIPGVGGLYSLKAWPEGQTEPFGWQLTHQEGVTDPQFGSFMLISHQRNVTFGNVTVAPVGGPDTTPPQIGNVQVTPGDTMAIVSWQTDEFADSSVAYGETASYEIGTEQDPTFELQHTMVLSGLTPETLYHYEITSEDPSGNAGSTADLTFMTTNVPLPTGFASDDFNRCQLNMGRWTFVNPKSVGSFAISGAGSGNAHLELSVPAGTPHDAWGAGGVNEGVRVMQSVTPPVTTSDFQIEVKFNSEPVAGFNDQGIVVEQDASNWIRFDIYHNNSVLKAFIGTTTGGSNTSHLNATIAAGSAQYLRLTRTGNQWNCETSPDGAIWSLAGTFTQALTVNAVGVYGANPVDGLDYTAEVDYFFNTLFPIAPEDGDQNTLTVDTVGNGAVGVDPDLPTYLCDDVVQLTALPDPGWIFDAWTGDLSGSTTPDTITITGPMNVTATFEEEICVPDCTGLVCGDDGCGGSCGSCDDGEVCTDDVCTAGACSNSANSNPCDDGNACTENDACGGGTCQPGAPKDCSDGQVCTDDVCTAGACSNPDNSDSCDDGDACTENDMCSGGTCQPGAPKDCSDGQVCTDDVCTAGVCSNPDNSDPCDDGNACTENDMCSGGICQPGAPKDCSDSEACTDDVCTAGVCSNPANSNSCDDGDACTENDTCSGGTCQPGAPKDCSDSEACTDDVCTAGVCSNPDNSDPCDDGDACTENDTCSGGTCQPGAPKDCSDSEACTDDVCTAGVCSNPDNSDPCDDGDACTENDTCSGGTCQPGAPKDCSDGSVCTDDVCTTGVCSNPPNADSCDDGDDCTENDTCAGSACQPGTPRDCSDGNACTNDLCTGGACANPANSNSCDDGDACTENDTCSGGACQAGTPKDCGDGEVCTDDVCTAGLCSNPPNASSCDDSNACTQTDTCNGAGQCIGTNPVVCADEADCTEAETCSSATGLCDPGAAKTAGTPCTSDGDICTDDECDGAGTCENIPDPTNDPSCVPPTTTTSTTSTTTSTTSMTSVTMPPTSTTLPDFPCGMAPQAVCFEAGKASFQIKSGTSAAKNQIKWKWTRGDATVQGDMGDPLNITTYALCVYDHTTGVASLATSLIIPPNGAWDDKDPKGWKYKDKVGAFDGVQKGQLRTGTAGKSKAQIKARGASIPMPTPLGATQFFSNDPSVIVQLVNNLGVCWNSEFTAPARKNDGEQFKAKAP